MKTNRLKKGPRTAFGRVMVDMFYRYTRHHVSRDAAALTYYLLFACFPLIILISSVIGYLQLNAQTVTKFIEQFMPEAATEFLEYYLTYVGTHQSKALLIFSIVFSFFFPWRAINALSLSVNKAFNSHDSYRPLKRVGVSFMITIGGLIFIIALVFLTMVGKRALTWVGQFINISTYFIGIWSYMRFVILFVLESAAISIFYMFGSGIRKQLKEVLPGAIVALLLSFAINIGYSFYVENYARYTQLYGSIANIVIVLIWLWSIGLQLILGAELNAAILVERGRQKELK